MATVPIDETFVSVREYLRTSYSPDREYVDGRIVERCVGEKGHATLQIFLGFLFVLHRAEWGIKAYTELRTHVAQTKFRIPDVLVVRKSVKFEHILDYPPLIAIEILSPDDRWSDVLEKVDEYLAFQVENVWIIDPQKRIAWRAESDGLHLVGEDALSVPGTPIRVVLSELFAELDQD